MKRTHRQLRWLALVVIWALALSTSVVANATQGDVTPTATLLTSGLAGETGSGSTIGPDGALYVTEGAAGRITRVDLATGSATTFAEGLPSAIVTIGGPMDVAFIDGTAYALVTLVGPSVGGSDVVGIYRIDGPNTFTIVADLGAWSIANPPTANDDFFVPDGVPYAIETYRGGFLVTDGHHGRVLYATLGGEITEMVGFADVVPTGLEARGAHVYVAQAGPVPHLPEDGKLMAFNFNHPVTRQVASGARLLVDVELGPGNTVYGLSQGLFTPGHAEGSPADPDTGSLVRVNRHGGFDVVYETLDRPTSFEIVGDIAYVVTLSGEVWRIEHALSPAQGRGRWRSEIS
jgi:hypothetical protein